jgi:hypothetical protein
MTGQDYKHGQDSNNRTGVLQHLVPVHIGVDKTTMTGQLRQDIQDRIFGIIDHFTMMIFSIFFTVSLGRPYRREDTGMGGSTFMMMSLLTVLSLSTFWPQTN